MTNNDEFFYIYTVHPTHLSDHNIVTLTTNLLNKAHRKDNIKTAITSMGFNDMNYHGEAFAGLT